MNASFVVKWSEFPVLFATTVSAEGSWGIPSIGDPLTSRLLPGEVLEGRPRLKPRGLYPCSELARSAFCVYVVPCGCQLTNSRAVCLHQTCNTVRLVVSSRCCCCRSCRADKTLPLVWC